MMLGMPLYLLTGFRILNMSLLLTVLIQDFETEEQFKTQNADSIMTIRKFTFALITAKIKLFNSYCYIIYGCTLWCNSSQSASGNFPSVYSDTFKRIACELNVPRSTCSTLVFSNIIIGKY